MREANHTNESLINLIRELKKASNKDDVKIWRRLASDLSKPTRERRAVNLSKISRFTQENDTVIVPGKVLASGELSHKLTVAAFKFSQAAVEKINNANGKAISIKDLMKESSKGKKLKIIG